MRYELADDQWTAIKPMLPNKPRGVPRVNDRRVLNGIFWALRPRLRLAALLPRRILHSPQGLGPAAKCIPGACAAT
jgi:transposase